MIDTVAPDGPSARVVQMPFRDPNKSPKPRPPRPRGPLDMIEWTKGFDLLRELTDNRAVYTVCPGIESAEITLYGWPIQGAVAVDTIRSRIDGRHPGKHPTLACAIVHGVEEIETDEYVQAMVALKNRFDHLDPMKPGREVAYVSESFGIHKPIRFVTSTSSQNVRMPLDLYASISELAGNLGLSTSALGLIAALTVFAAQPSVNRDHRATMQAIVEEFYFQVAIRVVTTQAMLDALKL